MKRDKSINYENNNIEKESKINGITIHFWEKHLEQKIDLQKSLNRLESDVIAPLETKAKGTNPGHVSATIRMLPPEDLDERKKLLNDLNESKIPYNIIPASKTNEIPDLGITGYPTHLEIYISGFPNNIGQLVLKDSLFSDAISERRAREFKIEDLFTKKKYEPLVKKHALTKNKTDKNMLSNLLLLTTSYRGLEPEIGQQRKIEHEPLFIPKTSEAIEENKKIKIEGIIDYVTIFNQWSTLSFVRSKLEAIAQGEKANVHIGMKLAVALDKLFPKKNSKNTYEKRRQISKIIASKRLKEVKKEYNEILLKMQFFAIEKHLYVYELLLKKRDEKITPEICNQLKDLKKYSLLFKKINLPDYFPGDKFDEKLIKTLITNMDFIAVQNPAPESKILLNQHIFQRKMDIFESTLSTYHENFSKSKLYLPGIVDIFDQVRFMHPTPLAKLKKDIDDSENMIQHLEKFYNILISMVYIQDQSYPIKLDRKNFIEFLKTLNEKMNIPKFIQKELNSTKKEITFKNNKHFLEFLNIISKEMEQNIKQIKDDCSIKMRQYYKNITNFQNFLKENKEKYKENDTFMRKFKLNKKAKKLLNSIFSKTELEKKFPKTYKTLKLQEEEMIMSKEDYIEFTEYVRFLKKHIKARIELRSRTSINFMQEHIKNVKLYENNNFNNELSKNPKLKELMKLKEDINYASILKYYEDEDQLLNVGTTPDVNITFTPSDINVDKCLKNIINLLKGKIGKIRFKLEKTNKNDDVYNCSKLIYKVINETFLDKKINNLFAKRNIIFFAPTQMYNLIRDAQKETLKSKEMKEKRKGYKKN